MMPELVESGITSVEQQAQTETQEILFKPKKKVLKVFSLYR